MDPAAPHHYQFAMDVLANLLTLLYHWPSFNTFPLSPSAGVSAPTPLDPLTRLGQGKFNPPCGLIRLDDQIRPDLKRLDPHH